MPDLSPRLPFFGWEGSPIDYRKKVGILILTSLLEDLDAIPHWLEMQANSCMYRMTVAAMI